MNQQRGPSATVLPPAIALRGEPPSIGQLRARQNALVSEIVDLKNAHADPGSYRPTPQDVLDRVDELEAKLRRIEATIRQEQARLDAEANAPST